MQTVTNAQQRYLDLSLHFMRQRVNLTATMSYARSREIHMACLLGHSVADTYSGADAFESDGTPVEYKSTIGNNITATYNGISVQPTWEDQEEYLCEHKIGCYPRHYYARYEGANVAEIWVMDSDTDAGIFGVTVTFGGILFLTLWQKNRKNGVTISTKEIKENGRRLI